MGSQRIHFFHSRLDFQDQGMHFGHNGTSLVEFFCCFVSRNWGFFHQGEIERLKGEVESSFFEVASCCEPFRIISPWSKDITTIKGHQQIFGAPNGSKWLLHNSMPGNTTILWKKKGRQWKYQKHSEHKISQVNLAWLLHRNWVPWKEKTSVSSSRHFKNLQRLPCFTNFAQIGKGKDASKSVDIPTIPTLPTASFTFGSCRRCHMKSDCPKPNPWMIPFEGFGSQSILSWTATWWNCWTLPTKTKYLPAKIQPSSLLPQVITSVRRTFVPGKACGRENKHQWMEMMSIPKPTCCNLPTATWLQESSGQDVRQKDCASKKSQSKDWVFSMSSFLAAFATTSGLGCDHVAGPFTWRYLFACQNCQCISWWNSLSLKLTAYPCSSK